MKPLSFISRGFRALKKNQEIMAALKHKPRPLFIDFFQVELHLDCLFLGFPFFFLTKFGFQEGRKEEEEEEEEEVSSTTMH